MNSIFKISVLILCSLSCLYGAPSFLTISDIHYGRNNVSRDGEDTGPSFLKITMKKFKKLSNQVDFILCLGDLPTHSLFNFSKKKEFEKTVFDNLYQNNQGLKPIFYIAGNNDSLLGNYQPFSANGVSPLTAAKDWQGACAHCKHLIIDGSHMYQDGYYSSYVIPGNKNIILIALNATQWTHIPLLFKNPHYEQDAETQLSWLDLQLQKHHAKQLLIAMHEPPGHSYNGEPIWHKQYLERFIHFLNKNKKRYGEITLLTSHSHMDEIRKVRLENGEHIYAYSTPSISRLHHNYPGMKVFDLDKQVKIKNFTTYYTSHFSRWTDQHYQAVDTANAIFPHCRRQTLAACLDKLTSLQVCAHLDKGLFYGVKSPKALKNRCTIIYSVFPD